MERGELIAKMSVMMERKVQKQNEEGKEKRGKRWRRVERSKGLALSHSIRCWRIKCKVGCKVETRRHWVLDSSTAFYRPSHCLILPLLLRIRLLGELLVVEVVVVMALLKKTGAGIWGKGRGDKKDTGKKIN